MPEAGSAPRRRQTARTGTKAKPTSPADRVRAYAEAVVRGDIIAGPHVRNTCRRHLKDLEDGHKRGLVWDLAAANDAINFFEDVLKLHEGQFEGRPFLLQPSQAFIIGSLFGWKAPHEDGDGLVRRFRRAYIEEGKGNGKSPLAGGIGLYGLIADREAGAQVYAAGATRDQAYILFRDAVKMVRSAPPLARRLGFSGGEGKEYNIDHLESGSFFKPLSRETKHTGSGPRPHFVLVDELHEHPDRGILETLERGFKSRRQPLLVMITNSGSDRKTVCWEEHEHAVKVAAGSKTPGKDFAFVGGVVDDSTFSYVCALDEGDDPLNDPSCWIKVNPLLGAILTEGYLAGVVAQAKGMPSRRNTILRLHFCVWTESADAWIAGEVLRKVLVDFDPAEHHGKEMVVGLDLASIRDLLAAAHVVRTEDVERPAPDGGTVMLPTFDAWVDAWTPAEGIAERSEADDTPYDLWAQEGHLHTTPGQVVRYDFVAQHFVEIDADFLIKLLAYDTYSYARFREALEERGLDLPEAAHPQSGRKRAKPPEHLAEAAGDKGEPPPEGLWMPGSLNALEELIFDERIRLRMNPALVSAMLSAAVEKDVLENRWFTKSKSTLRIDPLVALTMAIGAAMMVLVRADEGGGTLDDFLSNMVAA